MNPRLLGIAIFSLALHLNAFGSPKIALVRVKDIYVEQPDTKAAQGKAQKAKEGILLDPRAEELRTGLEALRAFQKEISNPDKQPTSEEGRKLARQFEIKRLEIRTLQEDFEKYRATREKEINTDMVNEMRSILDRITALARRTAKEKGYDILIDSSGNTNSSVPFVLYAKNPPDITDDVLAAIKDEDAAKDKPATLPAPTPTATQEQAPAQP